MESVRNPPRTRTIGLTQNIPNLSQISKVYKQKAMFDKTNEEGEEEQLGLGGLLV